MSDLVKSLSDIGLIPVRVNESPFINFDSYLMYDVQDVPLVVAPVIQPGVGRKIYWFELSNGVASEVLLGNTEVSVPNGKYFAFKFSISTYRQSSEAFLFDRLMKKFDSDVSKIPFKPLY